MSSFWRTIVNFKLINVLLFISVMCSQSSCVNTQKQLHLEKVESNTHCGTVKDGLGFMLISDEAAFQEIYASIHSLEIPTPAPPDVDFNRQHILLAYMGEKPTAGHCINFYDVVFQSNGEIKVTMSLDSPPPGNDLAQVITSPCAIAKVARGNYETATFVNRLNEVLDVVKVE